MPNRKIMTHHTGNNTNITIRPLNEADIPKIYGFFNGFPGASRKFYQPYTFDQDAISEIAYNSTTAVVLSISVPFMTMAVVEKLVGHVSYVCREESRYPL